MACDNEPGEVALRANTLVTDAAALAQQLPVRTHLDPGLAEALVLEEPFDAHGSQLWQQGAFLAQSRAAMRVARALAPYPASACSTCAPRPAARAPISPR